MLVFFAVIGASAGSFSGIAKAWAMVAAMTIMVFVHWVVLTVATIVLKLPIDAALVGSNACIGGPATATGECNRIQLTDKY